QRFDIDARALVEPVQRLQIHRHVARGVTRIIETALGEAADERHLAAFEADADRAAGAGRLPLAAATGGFAVPAGFALAESFAAMLGKTSGDRKSTRLNSSHGSISYAVFCLKKKTEKHISSVRRTRYRLPTL